MSGHADLLSAALAFVAASSGVTGALLLCEIPPRPTTGGFGARLLLRLAAAGRLLRPLGAPPDLRDRIEAAGSPAGLGAREVMAAKIASALLGTAVAVPLGALAPGRLGIALIALGPVAGFLAPDLWLARLAAERARRVRRDLPALLDMLRVTVEAGGSLTWALRSVGERSGGPLGRELRGVTGQVAVGVTLEAALEGLVTRLPQPEIRALVGALERARRHGAPLGETLATQARAARFSLARRIRDDAARAGPKLQLAVALLLVPSVLLLVAAALASALMKGGGSLPL